MGGESWRCLPVPGESLTAYAKRFQREQEASDPQDLRDLVALRAEQIREVFPEERLDVLHPVQPELSLPGGVKHQLEPVEATREGIQGAMLSLDDSCREAARVTMGRTFERSNESLYAAETWFRAGYGLRQIDKADLERPWTERLGRLVRQGWEKLLDRAMDLAERAGRILDHRAEQTWREQLRERPLESPFDAPAPTKPKEREKPKQGKEKRGIDF